MKPGGGYGFGNVNLKNFIRNSFGSFSGALGFSMLTTSIDVVINGYNTFGANFYKNNTFQAYAINEMGISVISATVDYIATILSAETGPAAPIIGYFFAMSTN